MFKDYKKTKNLVDHQIYKNFRNGLNKILILSKKNYYYNAFSVSKTSKESWKHVNSLLCDKKKFKNNIVWKDKDVLYHQSHDVSNIFNDYFTNLFVNTTVPDSSFMSYMDNKHNDTFFCFPPIHKKLPLLCQNYLTLLAKMFTT